MGDLSERLVRAADAAQGVALDPCGESGTRAAVAAVLRELAKPGMGNWPTSYQVWLADRADEIEATPSTSKTGR